MCQAKKRIAGIVKSIRRGVVLNRAKDGFLNSGLVEGGVSADKYMASGYSEVRELTDQTTSISTGMNFVGKISGEGSVRIHGRVEGEIHASSVLVAEGATVIGDINSNDVTVGGQFKGNIHGNRVLLKSTAIVEGEIYHRSLAIEENAQFDGVSRRQSGSVDNLS